MNKILLAIPMIHLSLMFTNLQRSASRDFYNNMSRTIAMVYMPMQEEGESVPTDSSFLNWIAKLFLWFIYLSVGIMILGGTWWSITSKRFWSWVICFFFAYFYSMLLGRYWGYTACLIGFVVLFFAMKTFLLYTSWGKAWKAKHLDSDDSSATSRS